MPKNYFTEGKNGLNGAKDQYDYALSAFLGYIDMFDPQLKESTQKYFADNPTAGIKDAKSAAKAEKKMAELKAQLDKMLETSEGKVNHFDGYLSFINKMMDTKKGDFSRAITENGYLSNMMHMVHNGPKNLDEETVKNLGPALAPLNKFFSGLSYLVDCEYEKQKVMENYSPEKEQDYLMNVSGIYFQMIQNQEELEKLVDTEGKSPYDQYLMQPLDVMTGKSASNVSGRRQSKSRMENIKGQYAAIQNGFGIYDLEMCGQISEMAFLAERKVKEIEHQLKPEILEKRSVGINNRITSAKNALEEAKKEVNEARMALEMLRKGNATKDQIEKQEIKLDNLEKNQLLREHEYNAVMGTLADEHNRTAQLSKSLEMYKKLSGALQALDKKTKNTKITKPTDKYVISDAFYKILNEAKAVPEIDNSFKKNIDTALKFTKNSMKYAGIVPENEVLSEEAKKHYFKPEDYRDYNALSSVKSAFSPPMGLRDAPLSHGFDIFIDLNDKRTNNKEFHDTMEDEIDMPDPDKYYHGVMKGNMWYIMKYAFPDDNKEVRDLIAGTLRKDLRIQQNAYTKFIESDKGYRNDFRREYKATSIVADESKGYIIQAMTEQPYVNVFFTHLFAEIPDLYLEGFDPDQIGKNLLENGITENLNQYMEAGKDIILAEYEKNRMRETGWDAKKEKLYLAKLHDAAKRSVESFNKLSALDTEVQETNWGMGNEIAHLTSAYTSTTMRDAKSALMGMEWAVKGIENGWSSKNLVAFQLGGMMEGLVERMRIKAEKKIEEHLKERNDNPTTEEEIAEEKVRAENVAALRSRLNEIREWQENTFKPFKEKLWGRQINSPLDELKTIIEIREFLKEQSKNPELKALNVGGFNLSGHIVKDLYDDSKDTLIPLSIENCVHDINEAEKAGIDLFEQKKDPVTFTICDKSHEMKTFLDALRDEETFNNLNQEERDRLREQMTAAFLRDKLLDGMNQDANPEYFDFTHPDYATIQRKLNDYTAQYANRLMQIFEGSDNKELADILENGNWNNLFAEMKDRMAAEASRMRLDSFVQGRPERNMKDISMSNAITNLENSPARFGSSSSLYNGIVSDLKELEKMRLSLGAELMAKYRTDFKIIKNVVTENGKEVTKLDYVLPEDVKVDDKKFKKYLDLQLDVMNRMDQYIQGKKDIIKKEGGDPEKIQNATLLGENGERRYKSMLDAKKALTNSINATKEFGNNGPSDSERVLLQKPNYNLHPKEYNTGITAPNRDNFKDLPEEWYNRENLNYEEEMEEARKVFVAEEKERILRDVKYNVLEDFRDIVHEFDKALEEEVEIRRGIVNQLNKIKAIDEILEKANTNPAFKKEFIESGKAAIFEANRAKYEEMKKSVPALEEQLTISAERSFLLEATKAKFVNHNEKIQKDLLDKHYKPLIKEQEEITAEAKRKFDEIDKAESDLRIAKEKYAEAEDILQDMIEEYENARDMVVPKEGEPFKAQKVARLQKKVFEQKEALFIAKNTMNEKQFVVDDLNEYGNLNERKATYDKEAKALDELKKKYAADYRVTETGGNVLIATQKISLQDYLKENEELRKVYAQLKEKGVKHLENFDKQVIQNNPFRDNYKKTVLENARKGYYDRESITYARDTILKKAAEANCNNKEALESVRQISEAMGSKLNINEIAENAKSLQAGAEADKNIEAEAPKMGGPKL